MSCVMVVDDDPAIRRMSRLILETEGVEVIAVASGEEALEALRRHMCTVMVLDLNMPGMDGRAVFEQVKHWPKRPAVVICSAFGAGDAKEQLGAEASISKPFDPLELTATVDALRDPEPAK